MKHQAILSIGNALVDLIIPLHDDQELSDLNLPKGSMQLSDLERRNQILEHLSGRDQALSSGGSAANTAYGIAGLGVSSGYIGRIGQDAHGQFFERDMQHAGVKTFLQYGEEATGTAITLMSPDSQRTFSTYLGAAAMLKPEELSLDSFTNYDIFHIEGYLSFNYDLLSRAVELARAASCRISLDLASYNVVEETLDFLRPLVQDHVNIVFANEEEAYAFTGKSPEDAVAELATLCDIAVVKVGADGSFVQSGGDRFHCPAVKAECLDSNGAGDGYAAGFLAALSRGEDLARCARAGSLVAAQVISTVGPRIKPEQLLNLRDLL